MLAVNTAERLRIFGRPISLNAAAVYHLNLAGIVGPKGIPEPVVQKLIEAL
jgi:hypothetical protein